VRRGGAVAAAARHRARLRRPTARARTAPPAPDLSEAPHERTGCLLHAAARRARARRRGERG
jgi:hypothetical protein